MPSLKTHVSMWMPGVHFVSHMQYTYSYRTLGSTGSTSQALVHQRKDLRESRGYTDSFSFSTGLQSSFLRLCHKTTVIRGLWGVCNHIPMKTSNEFSVSLLTTKTVYTSKAVTAARKSKHAYVCVYSFFIATSSYATYSYAWSCTSSLIIHFDSARA